MRSCLICLMIRSYWTFKHFGDYTTQDPVSETLYNEDGTVQMAKLKALSRTYAQKIAGKPATIEMRFHHNSTDKLFELSYEVNPLCAVQETVIYYNSQLHYPNGYSTSVEPSNMATVVPGKQPNTVIIKHNSGTQGEISFQLKAKSKSN